MLRNKTLRWIVCFFLFGGLHAGLVWGEDPICLEGETLVDAQPLETSLPALAELSAECESFETPTVRYLIGQDGMPYYIELTTSSGCEAADAELIHWITCWSHEPARCGSEVAPQEMERVVEWSGDVTVLDQPPCVRGTEVEPGSEAG